MLRFIFKMICFCILVNFSEFALTMDIKSCPLNNILWREAAKNLNCIPEINGTYHCILAFYGNAKVLNETCMTPSLINSEEVGCPNVRFIDEIPVFYRPFVSCRDDSGRCPGKNHRLYYTDQLYEYTPLWFPPAPSTPESCSDSSCDGTRPRTSQKSTNLKFPECIELEDKKSDTTAGVNLTTEGVGKISTSTEQLASTKASKCDSSESKCDLCSTKFVTAESHSKPIEVVSLVLLLIAVTMLAISLFCPTKFLTRLRWIRDIFIGVIFKKKIRKQSYDVSIREDNTHHLGVPTAVATHVMETIE